MILFWFICYPISKFLDNLLGTHGKTRYIRKDLKTLIELHEVERGAGEGPDGGHQFHGDNVILHQIKCQFRFSMQV